MDSCERLEHRVTEPLGALHPRGSRLRCLLGLELVGRHGIGERRRDAPVVDRGLGPLRLQLVEDLRQLSDLVLAEVELEGEEPQRPADAECAASTVEAPAPAPSELEAVPFGTGAGLGTARLVPAVTGLPPPPHHAWVHRSSSSPGLRAPGGLSARGRNASRVLPSLTPRRPASTRAPLLRSATRREDAGE